ncbi:MAG: SDR family NAD(P)-dependent oxidoreductase [Acidimicrobiales bacterium]
MLGGSTGAGKSTLFNSILGDVVSAASVRRPTTRTPVLACHVDDQQWFSSERVLPDLRRIGDGSGTEHRPGALRIHATNALPPGLALLDAPDIDSVETANRSLADQLLAAANLWVFVTTAARYADAIPWEVLSTAAQRGTVRPIADRHGGQPGRRRTGRGTARGRADRPAPTRPPPESRRGLNRSARIADMQRFLGRRALVTGASRGIGAGIAHRLAAEGAAVAIAARTAAPRDEIAGSLEETARVIERYGNAVATFVVDLGSPDARADLVVRAAAALDGPIEILVNNAAASMHGPLLTYTPKRRGITWQLNVEAPLDLAQQAIPTMQEIGHGWVVNLTSGSARHEPGPPFRDALPTGYYGASKAALDRLTNALALETHGTGVRVNAIRPRAAVRSEGADAILGADFDPRRFEPMESMVEAAVALCACGPDQTGWVGDSLTLLDEWDLVPRRLDASGPA